MYLEYYGLREPPFSITPDPRYVFLSERHRDALAHLLVRHRQGRQRRLRAVDRRSRHRQDDAVPAPARTAAREHARRARPESEAVAGGTGRIGVRGVEARHHRQARQPQGTDRHAECVSARCVRAGPSRRADRRRGAEPLDRFAGTGAPPDQSRDADAEIAADHSAGSAGTSRRARATGTAPARAAHHRALSPDAARCRRDRSVRAPSACGRGLVAHSVFAARLACAVSALGRRSASDQHHRRPRADGRLRARAGFDRRAHRRSRRRRSVARPRALLAAPLWTLGRGGRARARCRRGVHRLARAAHRCARGRAAAAARAGRRLRRPTR